MNEKSLSERIFTVITVIVVIGMSTLLVTGCIAGSLLLIKFCLQHYGLWG